MDTLRQISNQIGDAGMERAFSAVDSAMKALDKGDMEIDAMEVAITVSALCGSSIGAIVEETADIATAIAALSIFYSAITEGVCNSVDDAIEELQTDAEAFYEQIAQIFNQEGPDND